MEATITADKIQVDQWTVGFTTFKKCSAEDVREKIRFWIKEYSFLGMIAPLCFVFSKNDLFCVKKALEGTDCSAVFFESGDTDGRALIRRATAKNWKVTDAKT